MAKSYRDLIAWQKAIALVTEIYRITRQFPIRNSSQFSVLSSQVSP